MNRKRFYRYRYRRHSFSTLLTAATTAVVTAAIALAVLSPTVFSRACPPPRKFSSCSTIVPRQTVGVTRHFRSTKTCIAATGSRFTTTVYNRQRPYVARPLGSTRRQLYETVTVGLTDGKDGHANNTNTNNTRCYKIKYTTPVPTTKRWSPILKTYPQFPVTNNTATKSDTDTGAATTTARTKVTTKITKTIRSSTTTEATDLSDEMQDMVEETTSIEETTCSEETTCTEETTFTEETTCAEETAPFEETTPKKKMTSKTEETKNIINEPTRTEKVSRTTEKSSKSTVKSNKTVKVTKGTKKMTRTTEEEIDEVTCPEDPECTDEPSCIDNEVTKNPTKTRSSPDQKSTAIIKQKNRSKKRHHHIRRSSTTMYNQWSLPSSLSLSSGTTVLDDSSWSHDGLNNYKSLKLDLNKDSEFQPPPIDQKGIHI